MVNPIPPSPPVIRYTPPPRRSIDGRLCCPRSLPNVLSQRRFLRYATGDSIDPVCSSATTCCAASLILSLSEISTSILIQRTSASSFGTTPQGPAISAQQVVAELQT